MTNNLSYIFTICKIWRTRTVWLKTRWTFFKDKLVFEYDFWDILVLWTLGPLDLQTMGPFDSWTFHFFYLFPPPQGDFNIIPLFLWSPHTSFLFLPATQPSSQTSSQFPLPPPQGCQMTSEFIQEEISMLFCSEKFSGWRWWWWWHCNYSFKLQVFEGFLDNIQKTPSFIPSENQYPI